MGHILATKKEIAKIRARKSSSLASELWNRSPKGRKFKLLAKELARRYK